MNKRLKIDFWTYITLIIAVMKNGVIQQVGSPVSIYTRPYNVFVATFIGHSNLFYATIKIEGNDTYLLFRCGYKLKMDNLLEVKDGDEVIVGIRPEEFFVNTENEEGIKAKILAKTFLGRYTNYLLHFNDNEIVPDQPSIEYSQDSSYIDRMYEKDEIITLKPNANKINVFTPDMERSLIKGVKKYE